MATEVANLRAYLDADTDQFDRKMRSADSRMDKVGKSGQRNFRLLGTAAKLGFGAITAGAGALVVGAGYSIKAASDLNESINAVNVVFGKASQQIFAFGKTAATSAGLSMRQLNEAVTPLGAALQNAGYSADQAAKASIQLTQRAADMSSVFNTDLSESLSAIQAGLRGELDPLEKFGVSLNEAALQSYAVKTGIAGANDELTAAQKVQARLGLIMEQTNKVQGDFANTSDGLANQQRILKAQLENVSAEVGQALIPVMARFMKFLNTEGIPALRRLGNRVMPVVKEAAEAVADAFDNWRESWEHLTRVLDEHEGTVDKITVAVRALITATEIIIKIQKFWLNVFITVWETELRIAQRVGKEIIAMYHDWRDAIIAVKNATVTAAHAVRDFFQSIWNGVQRVTGPLGKIADIFGGIKGAVSGAAGAVGGLFSGDGIIGTGLGAAAGGLRSVSPTLFDDYGIGRSMGLTLSSGYRPGAVTSTGNPSLHGVYPSKAIDMAGSESAMRRFFLLEVARGALTGLREVIHSPYWWHPGSGITRIPASAGSVLRDHYSHVHVGSYDQGGFLRPGWNLAYNGTGRPEPVGGGITLNVGGSVIAERDLMALIRRLETEHKRRGGI